jgi:pimeloyl-ACP methyl ester carboxylesterase
MTYRFVILIGGFTITDPSIICGDVPAIAREAQRVIPNAFLVPFFNSGHLPFYEERDRFNRVLIEWVTKLHVSN